VTGQPEDLRPNAKKIHVELDPAEINKNVKVDLPLLGDVAGDPAQLVPHSAASTAPIGLPTSRR
jgi:acetolactate synthase-1/2/3 large subunit